LAVRFINNYFIEVYDPTIEDNYKKQVTVDEETIILDILDTAGQEQFSAMRDHYMRTGHGFILCYSVVQRTSFDEIGIFRNQIMKVKDTDKVPMVLCGTKCDLEKNREISKSEGEARANLWGATFYETSAKTCLNIEDTFFGVVRAIRKQHELYNSPKKPKLKHHSCNLL